MVYTQTFCKSPVVMYIGDYTSTSGEKDPFYTIEIQAKEKSKPEASFPINEINAEMAPVIYTGPTPTGSSFIVSYPYGKGAQDVKVTIAGGDKTSFVQALIDAGFNYDSSYSYAGQYKAYTKPTDNLAIYIQETTSNTDYYMEVGTYSYF